MDMRETKQAIVVRNWHSINTLHGYDGTIRVGKPVHPGYSLH